MTLANKETVVLLLLSRPEIVDYIVVALPGPVFQSSNERHLKAAYSSVSLLEYQVNKHCIAGAAYECRKAVFTKDDVTVIVIFQSLEPPDPALKITGSSMKKFSFGAMIRVGTGL